MRPRVFPAEDLRLGGADVRERVPASMRPRVFPAEDREGTMHGNCLFLASMRPRVFPAEDLSMARPGGARQGRASMRPRVFPAEDNFPFSSAASTSSLQ